MTEEQRAKLPVYFGLHFDPETGKTYTENGADTGYTFERATWSGPFGLAIPWPWLNPISFATRETGLRVLEFARKTAPKDLSVSLDETQRVFWPFTRTVERLIVVSGETAEERYSAGWLASSIIRHGEDRAGDLWRAELRHAGLVN